MHKKLFLLAVLAFVFLISSTSCASGNLSGEVVFRVGNNTYTINDETTTMDAVPFIENSRTFIPVRYLAICLSVPESNILWSSSARTVTLKTDTVTMEMAVGGHIFYVNDAACEMDVTPLIINGRTYLPARYVAEPFGYMVRWDAAARSVSIVPEGADTEPAANEAEKIVEQVKTDLADNKEVSVSTIGVKEITQVEWPDTSLGCPEPGLMYAQVITPGYKIILSDGSTDYEYHAGNGGNLIFCSSFGVALK
ncbi:MAG: copper amine oxidase N-terminal domain-containing protein [Bacillota bacterium]